jgi:3-dehydroquinate synthase
MKNEFVNSKYLDVPVVFYNLNQEFNLLISNYQNCVIICDNNSHKNCYPIFKDNYSSNINQLIISIEAGETHKNLESCQSIYSTLLLNNISKNTLVIALGGGVICDIAGFIASTYKRGIDFAFFPTTNLAMVDAAIGGKNGVNFQYQKNMIGCIHQPKAIFIDTDFLKTLPEVELKNGFAETLKHALISDRDYFAELDFTNALSLIQIEQSAAIKMKIVELDVNETHLRKALNAGHTIGHAIESFSLENDAESISHGFAVVVGLFAESYIAYTKNLLSFDDFNFVVEKLKSIYPKYLFQEKNINSIYFFTLNDKKNDDNIRCSLLNGIGKVLIDVACSENEIKDSLLYYLNNY